MRTQVSGRERVSAASAGGNALSYAVVTQPAHGVLSTHHRQRRMAPTHHKPATNYTGADSFTYTATDNGTSVISANATVSITVAVAPPPATSPQVDDAAFTLYQDQPLSGTLSAADAAGNTVNYSVVQPSHGSISLTATSRRPSHIRAGRRLHRQRQFHVHRHRHRHHCHLLRRHRDP